MLRGIIRSLPTGLAVLGFGFLVSFLLWTDINERQQGKKDAIFIGETNRVGSLMISEARRYVDLVHSTLGLFIASDRVSEDELITYLKTVPVAKNFPAIQGMGYTLFLNNDELTLDDKVALKIFPDGERNFYAPVQYYIVDGQSQDRFVGFDILTEKVRSKAAFQARDSGLPQVSSRTFLPTSSGEVVDGVYIYAPLNTYRGENPSLQDLRKSTKGFVFAAVDLERFFESIVTDRTDGIAFKVYESKTPRPETLVYNSHSGVYDDIESRDRFRHVYTEPLGTNNYTIVFERLENFNDGIDDSLNDVSLLAGVAISILAFLLVMFLMNNRITALVMARRITSELETSRNHLKRQTEYLKRAEEVAGLGHWRFDPETDHFEWSDQLAAFHNWHEIGLIPLQIALDAIRENDRDIFRTLIRQAIGDGKPFTLSTALRPDEDTERFVQIRGEAEFDDNGSVIGLFGIYVDETNRLMKDLALQQSEEQRSMAVEAANVGLWDWEISTGKLYWSAELLKIVGLSEEDFEPTFDFFENLIHEEDRRRFLYALDQHIISGNNFISEYRLYKKDGTYVWVQSRARAVRDDQEIPLRISGTTADITDWKRAEAALVEAQHEANAANQAKSDFLAMMSHELRTPMTGIMGMIDLLKSSTLEPDQHNYINKISTSADMLLTMLNDVLDLSKLESGKFDLEEIDFSLSYLCSDVKNLFEAKAAEKSNTISIEIEESVPPVVVGDPIRIRQVLYNLVGNAIKFTEEGNITIRVSRVSDDAELIALGFEVEDTGIGLSREQQRMLFQPYVQAESSITRRFGGTGLGLAICKQLTEAMHGEIGVRGELGVGSNFWFNIQVKPSAVPLEQLAQPVKEKTEITVTTDSLSILVAEDNDVNRELIETMLTRKGHKVSTVRNGEEVLDNYRSLAPDVILMDIQMPILDGEAATEAIRSIEMAMGSSQIPIVALTADVLPEHQKSYRAKGFTDVLEKPIDWRHLDLILAKIAQHDTTPTKFVSGFGQRRRERSELIDHATIDGLVAVLTKTRVEVLLEEAIENARSQIEELLVAIDEDDSKEIARHCHTLRGMTSNFGLKAVASLANDIESMEPKLLDTDDLLANSEDLLQRVREEIKNHLGT